MFDVCIANFVHGPWDIRLRDEIFQTFVNYKKIKFNIDKIDGYPKKKYDLIFLPGIRLIKKKHLDIKLLRKFCRYIVEFGDYSGDERDGGADLYFYSIEDKVNNKSNYKYLPKFIDENILYPEQTDKLTFFVDHYKHQNENEKIISNQAIHYIFKQIYNLDISIDVYFHSEKGLEKNPKQINIPINNKMNFKIIPYDEIIKIYRKTHLFFPTHRETMGLVAQEIGMCGGLTVMQKWMYPEFTHNEFNHYIYSFKQPIDFKFIFNLISRDDFLINNRRKVLEKYTISQFRQNLLEYTLELIC